MEQAHLQRRNKSLETNYQNILESEIYRPMPGNYDHLFDTVLNLNYHMMVTYMVSWTDDVSIYQAFKTGRLLQ